MNLTSDNRVKMDESALIYNDLNHDLNLSKA